MPNSLRLSLALMLCLGLAATAVSPCITVRAQAAPEAASVDFYLQRVKPIFDANCARCHSGMSHRGGLNLDTRANLLKGGHSGPALVPGNPEASLLLKLIRHEGPADDPMPMPPPPREKLSAADISTLTAWVKAGAPMPEEAASKK